MPRLPATPVQPPCAGLALPLPRRLSSGVPGEGWSDESGSDVSASSSRDQLALAQKLEAQGQRDSALKAYKGTPAPLASLHLRGGKPSTAMGKILEDEAEFYPAFQAFQENGYEIS